MDRLDHLAAAYQARVAGQDPDNATRTKAAPAGRRKGAISQQRGTGGGGGGGGKGAVSATLDVAGTGKATVAAVSFAGNTGSIRRWFE
jgi:hypothetical protein